MICRHEGDHLPATLTAEKSERFFVSYAELPPEERGVGAFALLAAEPNAFEVIRPRLQSLIR